MQALHLVDFRQSKRIFPQTHIYTYTVDLYSFLVRFSLTFHRMPRNLSLYVGTSSFIPNAFKDLIGILTLVVNVSTLKLQPYDRAMQQPLGQPYDESSDSAVPPGDYICKSVCIIEFLSLIACYVLSRYIRWRRGCAIYVRLVPWSGDQPHYTFRCEEAKSYLGRLWIIQACLLYIWGQVGIIHPVW